MTIKWNDLARNDQTVKQSERIAPLLTYGSPFITLVRTMHPFLKNSLNQDLFGPFTAQDTSGSPFKSLYRPK